MEGVGARLGRSSSRYGNTTVFTGPVRKWKKDWVPITPSSSSNNPNNHNHQNQNNPNNNPNNGNSNTNVSHLRLYKWTPLSNSTKGSPTNQSNGNMSDGESPAKEDSKEDEGLEKPPKKKFRYVPIAVLEEQKKEAESEQISDDEGNPTDADENKTEQSSKSDDHSEKPDINDVPMEENEDTEEQQTGPVRQDLNESLDLN